MFHVTSRRGNFNPFSPYIDLPNSPGSSIIQEAIVVDTITNDSHAEYSSDGYNVGAIKFRFLFTDKYRNNNQLNWAFPLNPNLTDYPLINEIVFIYKSLNRFYYNSIINVSNKPVHQAIFGLNTELDTPEGSSNRITRYNSATANPVVISSNLTDKLGKKFVDLPKISRLRSDEGDIIYEGRSGHSIRFGTSWLNKGLFPSSKNNQSPNILLRVGADPTQTPTADFGLVQEDINNDMSSIWVVSDQIIPLKYSTVNSSVHQASIVNFPKKLDGNQIVINSDRFVVNSKKDRIMGFALNGINWTSGKDFTVDAQQDYISKLGRNWTVTVGKDIQFNVAEKTSINSPKVFLGSVSDTTQPIPCGELLAKFLVAFIDAHLNNAGTYAITSQGPASLAPGVVSALNQLKVDLERGAMASFNSKSTFIIK